MTFTETFKNRVFGQPLLREKKLLRSLSFSIPKFGEEYNIHLCKSALQFDPNFLCAIGAGVFTM